MNEIEHREISPDQQNEDGSPEQRIRPQAFDTFVGQTKLMARMGVAVKAAKLRNEPLDHVLLSGPPGLGKTTLAHIIAHEMGVDIHTTSGPAIDKKGDLAGMLTQLQEGDVLFIDEIHRLNAVIEENLYPAMEDFHFDVMMGAGPGASTISLPLNAFTLVGATTRTGLLTAPLRSRFGISERLSFYTVEHLYSIVRRTAEILDVKLSKDGAHEIARRSRGTPRIANRLLRRVRDYATVENRNVIDIDLASTALEKLEVDENGFDHMDRMLLITIIDKFDGGPVGLDTLSAATGESSNSIEDVYEPFLLQQGYIHRTPRGRVATNRAFEFLGRSMPGNSEDQEKISF
jgi:Holliday junction DNA helicase RuvB